MASAREEAARCLCAALCAWRRPGIQLETLARMSGAGTLRRIRRDLAKLSLVGRPPFGPDDLLETETTPAGRVRVRGAGRLFRMDALTRPEAVALAAHASLNLYGEDAEGAAARNAALNELLALAPQDFRLQLKRVCRSFFRRPLGGEAHAAAARRAIVRGCPVRAASACPGRSPEVAPESRELLLRPQSLHARGGTWVLEGVDGDGKRRTLDLALVRTLTLADAAVGRDEPGQDASLSAVSSPSEGCLRAVIDCSDEASARAVAFGSPVFRAQVSRRRGAFRVTLEASESEPLAALVVSLGGKAVVRSPESLRDKVLDLAASVVADWL